METDQTAAQHQLEYYRSHPQPFKQVLELPASYTANSCKSLCSNSPNLDLHPTHCVGSERNLLEGAEWCKVVQDSDL